MPSNIQLYWDGNSGVCTYGNRKKFYTEKPDVPTVTFDKIIYAEDDNVHLKVLGGATSELTETDITAIKQFCDANATLDVSSSMSVDEHNTDITAHHDIRVSLSNLHEYAHRVASVWSTEVSLSEAVSPITIPWDYVVGDSVNCTDSTDSTIWKCPVTESYDFVVRLGFEGLNLSADTTVTVNLLKNGTEVLATGSYTYKKDSVGLPSLELRGDGITLSEGDKISVQVKMPVGYGIIVPSRSFLVVDNHGAVMAKRQADFIFNTMANFVFYNGYEATLNGDATGAQIIASKWNTEVITIN